MKTTLKTKLLINGLIMTLVPLAIAAAVMFLQTDRMVDSAAEVAEVSARTDLDHIAQNVYAMCQAQQELLEQNLKHSLNVARDILQNTGKIGLSQETITWNAVNQFSKVSQSLTIPKMTVGETWLGQNSDPKQSSPVVDHVKKLVGGTCTIFQRISDNGDMLRVCTNVETLDGKRAIGTYIPKTQQDGQANPVVSALLEGKTFTGRAFVVNKWYLTTYEPLFDDAKNVIGALYFGVPQESVASLREAIMNVKVGQTGYIYVLDSKGNYVISKGGKRDGECLWDAKDANGSLFIQEICKKATALKNGEIGEQMYPWKNPEDSQARMKIARLIYFEPWDWVIGASSYMDEFMEGQNKMKQVGLSASIQMWILLAASCSISTLIWYMMSRKLTGRLNQITNTLSESSAQLSSSSSQISSASQSLAEGATEQAAGLEEASSSLEEMSAMTRQNADNAAQASTLSSEARKAANHGSESMSQMESAINQIQKSSDETAKIIKVIDEIAFQTNLLALNAAVEAARAGEAGKGFAVVAEEVRNLAIRSAEAAKNTSALIEQSVANSQNGVEICGKVKSALNEIVSSISKTTDLVSEIAAASNEQAQGVDQINGAVSQMDKVVQQNAANAEQSASASHELTSQAQSIDRIVDQLAQLVNGTVSKTVSPETHSAKTVQNRLTPLDHAFHHIAGSPKNCWEEKKCGRIPGGDKAKELGVCPAYPDHGSDCWKVAGTFCGGKVQGSFAQKLKGCSNCKFYQNKRNTAKIEKTNNSCASILPLDDQEFKAFNG